MQSFNNVKGSGLRHLRRPLIELGYIYSELKASLPHVLSLLPDPTNISRRIQYLAAEYSLKLTEALKKALKSVKIIGISSDH